MKQKKIPQKEYFLKSKNELKLEHTLLHTVFDQMSGVPAFCFLEDITTVLFDSQRTDEQFFTNFVIAVAIAYQIYHVYLSFGKHDFVFTVIIQTDVHIGRLSIETNQRNFLRIMAAEVVYPGMDIQ